MRYEDVLEFLRKSRKIQKRKFIYYPLETAIHIRKIKGKGYKTEVPVRRELRLDRSRYTGAKLREIRADRGCGRPLTVAAFI